MFVRLAGIYTVQGRLLIQVPTDCREVSLDGVNERKMMMDAASAQGVSDGGSGQRRSGGESALARAIRSPR